MKNLTYKQFIKTSKWLTNFKDRNIFMKLNFYIQAPFRYLIFKRIYKNMIEKEGK